MSAKPILFTTVMVQSILDGNKTQTRRVIKPQPQENCDKLFGPEMYEPVAWDKYGDMQPGKPIFGVYDKWGEYGIKCPYRPNNILWVKETWAPFDGEYLYRADSDEYTVGEKIRWHPSIFMPREAARLFLTVADVRVERLQDITEEDARAEGMHSYALDRDEKWCQYTVMAAKSQSRERPIVADEIGAVALFWDAKYGKKYPWKSNPWVWVISFEIQGKEA